MPYIMLSDCTFDLSRYLGIASVEYADEEGMAVSESIDILNPSEVLTVAAAQVTAVLPKRCTCSVADLWAAGCKCGGK